MGVDAQLLLVATTSAALKAVLNLLLARVGHVATSLDVAGRAGISGVINSSLE
jgi:hypothetical protein